MHAYDELYLNKAMTALGGMLQFAVYDLGLDASDFYRRFLHTEIADRFGRGEAKYTVGMSGAELAYEVLRLTDGSFCSREPSCFSERTPEYWAGWALAYYEWDRNLSFRRIERAVPIDQIIDMYAPYHEADVRKFADELDRRIGAAQTGTQLARLRSYAELTQKALAERSGVSVRMIEQYEQGKKALNRASADTVRHLAQALHCGMEELIV